MDRVATKFSSPGGEDLNENAIYGAVEPGFLMNLGGSVRRAIESDVEVDAGIATFAGGADKVFGPEILGFEGFSADGLDHLAEARDEIVDASFVGTGVENKGGSVVAFGSSHRNSKGLGFAAVDDFGGRSGTLAEECLNPFKKAGEGLLKCLLIGGREFTENPIF